jgi:N-acetylglucosaminyldiphosphoundecaprenol N-acetyl-beta-D-mannosaminyltransferase
MVLVAYGAPGQVLWITRNRAALGAGGVRIAVGVGGAFDFLAGRVPRAPRPVRLLGFEWLYRLAREPWRWRRQLALPRFVGLVVVGRLRGGSNQRGDRAAGDWESPAE